MINPLSDTYCVLSVLRQRGSISESEAMIQLGIKRLSARINDLKNEGYKIKTELKQVVKRSGRKTMVTDRYVLDAD